MHVPVSATPGQAIKPCPAPGKKHSVICWDGTGNQFGDSNFNVVTPYTALTVDNDQIGYYHRV